MISKFLRGEYGDNEQVDPVFVANIYAMDRYMYKNQLIKDLEENDIVVMDRYVFSNIAYQAAKAKTDYDKEHMFEILNFEFGFLDLPYPDVTLFFDVQIEEIKRRLELSRTGDDRNYLNGKQDIHEKDIDYQSRVRDIYLEMNKRGTTNFFVIKTYNDNGVLSPNELFDSYVNFIK
jgi:dTMP kinase